MRYLVHYVWFDQRAIKSTCRLKPLKPFGPLLKVPIHRSEGSKSLSGDYSANASCGS